MLLIRFRSRKRVVETTIQTEGCSVDQLVLVKGPPYFGRCLDESMLGVAEFDQEALDQRVHPRLANTQRLLFLDGKLNLCHASGDEIQVHDKVA
jgi:hypothetical protein